jgi:hypothetical protein
MNRLVTNLSKIIGNLPFMKQLVHARGSRFVFVGSCTFLYMDRGNKYSILKVKSLSDRD